MAAASVILLTTCRILSPFSEEDTYTETSQGPANAMMYKDMQQNASAEVQKLRKIHLKAACARYQEQYSLHTAPDDVIFKRMHVIDELNLVICPVNKVGSTFWRNLARRYQGKRLETFPDEKKRQILSSYTKAMFVRHPFIRLRSAFHDRFVGMHPVYIERYVSKIVSADHQARPTLKCLSVTFEEFVDFITRKELFLNHHWKQYYRLCNPCTIEYDFIGHMETFNEDIKLLQTFLSSNISLVEPEESKKRLDAKLIDACRPMEARLSKFQSLPLACSSPTYLRALKLRSLEMKGYISKNETFVLSGYNKHLWYNQCREQLEAKLTDATVALAEVSHRKWHSIKQSYKILSSELFRKLKSVYKLDFQLFDYEPETVL